MHDLLNNNDPMVFALIVLTVFVIHFIPSVIAFANGHTRRKLILLLNVLMGWTVIGWVVLLVWAINGSKTST